MTFPLVNPVRSRNFFVTMWDTPTSIGGGAAGIVGAASSAVLNMEMAIIFGGFSAVEGLDAGIEIEAYHEGGHSDEEHLFFSYAKYPKLVLKRGITFNTDLWDWHHQVISGKTKMRKSGTIILLDNFKLFDTGTDLDALKLPVAAWTFYNALPEKLSCPELDAKAAEDAIAYEKVELRAEKIERLSLALIPGVADLNVLATGLIGIAGAAAGAGLSAGVAAAI